MLGKTVICLGLGAYQKPFFLFLHSQVQSASMYSIAIDLVGTYKAPATAKRQSRERTLSWTNWLIQQHWFTCLNNKTFDISLNSN